MAIQIITGDCREELAKLPAESVHCTVTSPPYFGLRDYGVEGQIGLEETLEAYVETLVAVFRDVRRVLRKDGTVWLNLGDSYTSGGRKTRDPGQSKIHPAYEGERYAAGLRPADPVGLKPKDLMMIPARVALALQADGWWLRSDIIWNKPNPMPESVTDRPTSAHEHVFLLAKSAKYYFDAEAAREGREGNTHSRGTKRSPPIEAAGQGHKDWCKYMTRDEELTSRNLRNVWSIATAPFSEAHFATFPPALVEPCIKAGCPEGGTVIDPFGGAGTTGLVADRLGRNAVLIELNPEYAEMARCRIAGDAPLFAEVS